MEQTVNIILNAIATVGFPICCVIAMFYFWNKEREEHKKESETLASALNNNTEVLKEIQNNMKQQASNARELEEIKELIKEKR